MPYASREVALARKRKWAKANPRPKARSERIVGEDANWIVLECVECFQYFDVPKSGSLRKKCRDCRKKEAHHG